MARESRSLRQDSEVVAGFDGVFDRCLHLRGGDAETAFLLKVEMLTGVGEDVMVVEEVLPTIGGI